MPVKNDDGTFNAFTSSPVFILLRKKSSSNHRLAHCSTEISTYFNSVYKKLRLIKTLLCALASSLFLLGPRCAKAG